LIATVAREFVHALDPSVEGSGPHDFAVRIGGVRLARQRVHRVPHHVRDDRDTPLLSERDVRR